MSAGSPNEYNGLQHRFHYQLFHDETITSERVGQAWFKNQEIRTTD